MDFCLESLTNQKYKKATAILNCKNESNRNQCSFLKPSVIY